MYLVSAFLCAYAGFAALCAITTRNAPLVWTTPPTRGVVTALRVAGFLLLALSWLPWVMHVQWPLPATLAWFAWKDAVAELKLAGWFRDVWDQFHAIVVAVTLLGAVVLTVYSLLVYLYRYRALLR